VTESDPFGATLTEVLGLIAECGALVVATEDAPERPEGVTYLTLIYARRARLPREIPSMGGAEIGGQLREWAHAVCPRRAIVELGVWLGAGTMQMAIAAHRTVRIYAYDRYRANASEIGKAAKQGVTLLPRQDTQPVVNALLARRRELIDCDVVTVKGEIPPASYDGEPIGLYLDDACKRREKFLGALRVFGPHWVAGETIVVLMDYWYFERKPHVEGLRFQFEWMQRHHESFEVVAGRMADTSSAAFLYCGGEPWREG
jgi:hypothetical protein